MDKLREFFFSSYEAIKTDLCKMSNARDDAKSEAFFKISNRLRERHLVIYFQDVDPQRLILFSNELNTYGVHSTRIR